MGILWADGFDTYSLGGNDDGGTAQMLDGLYAEITASGTGIRVRNLNPRTGSCAIRYGANSNATALRRILGPGISRTTVGVAMALYLDNIPSANNRFKVVEFRNADNTTQCSVGITSTGAIDVYRGNIGATQLAVSGSGTIVAQAYQHIEVKVHIHASEGSIEVRVDGQTVVDIANVNTNASGPAECSQLNFLGLQGSAASGATPVDLDDVVVWDTNGDGNNDFLGDVRVYTSFPIDDVELDWTSTEATGYEAIDEIPADGDTSYIQAGAAGDVALFEVEPIPESVTQVLGVMTVHKSRKTDAGVCDFQSSVVSGEDEALGPQRPITEAWTYYFETFDLDPATLSPWTPAARNAMNIKIERTAD